MGMKILLKKELILGLEAVATIHSFPAEDAIYLSSTVDSGSMDQAKIEQAELTGIGALISIQVNCLRSKVSVERSLESNPFAIDIEDNAFSA